MCSESSFRFNAAKEVMQVLPRDRAARHTAGLGITEIRKSEHVEKSFLCTAVSGICMSVGTEWFSRKQTLHSGRISVRRMFSEIENSWRGLIKRGGSGWCCGNVKLETCPCFSRSCFDFLRATDRKSEPTEKSPKPSEAGF